MITMMLGGFIIPAILIIVMYVLLIFKLKSHSNNQILVRKNSKIVNDGKNTKPSETIPLKESHNLTQNTDQNTETCSNEIIEAIRNEKDNDSNNIMKKNFKESKFEMQRVNVKNSQILSSNMPTKQSNFEENYSKSQLKVTRNVALYIFVYCISWGPYAAVTLICQFSDNRENYINRYTAYIPILLAKTSVLINPLIYVLNNRKIRIKLKKSISYIFCKNMRRSQ